VLALDGAKRLFPLFPWSSQTGPIMKLTATTVRTLKVPEGKSDAIFFDDDLPGFGLRLRAEGSRTFVYQYKLGTKHRRMVLGAATAVTVGEARETARASMPA
jgi:hypothetical protein